MEDKKNKVEDGKNKVAYEVALEEFERFAESWRLDIEVDTMTGEDAEDFEQMRRKVTLQISSGNALVNAEGDIEYTLFKPVGSLTAITMKRPGGAAYKATDMAKEGRNMTKTNLLMASAIGQMPAILVQMDGIDYKYITAVYGLFLGS